MNPYKIQSTKFRVLQKLTFYQCGTQVDRPPIYTIIVLCYHEPVFPTFTKHTSLPLPKFTANIDFLEDGWHFSWGKYIWIGYFSSSGLPDHCSSTIQPSWPSLATTTRFVNHCYSFAILGCSPFLLFLKPTSPLPPNLCNHVFFLPHCLQPLLCFFCPAFGLSFSYSFFSATLSSQQGDWMSLTSPYLHTNSYT